MEVEATWQFARKVVEECLAVASCAVTGSDLDSVEESAL